MCEIGDCEQPVRRQSFVRSKGRGVAGGRPKILRWAPICQAYVTHVALSEQHVPHKWFADEPQPGPVNAPDECDFYVTTRRTSPQPNSRTIVLRRILKSPAPRRSLPPEMRIGVKAKIVRRTLGGYVSRVPTLALQRRVTQRPRCRVCPSKR